MWGAGDLSHAHAHRPTASGFVELPWQPEQPSGCQGTRRDGHSLLLWPLQRAMHALPWCQAADAQQRAIARPPSQLVVQALEGLAHGRPLLLRQLPRESNGHSDIQVAMPVRVLEERHALAGQHHQVPRHGHARGRDAHAVPVQVVYLRGAGPGGDAPRQSSLTLENLPGACGAVRCTQAARARAEPGCAMLCYAACIRCRARCLCLAAFSLHGTRHGGNALFKKQCAAGSCPCTYQSAAQTCTMRAVERPC